MGRRKRRISGGNGHLSNRQALELFLAHKAEFLSHIFLSHLSKENNTPQLVAELFSTHAQGVQVIIASRYEETPVFTIGNTNLLPLKEKPALVQAVQLQLSL